MDAFKFYEEHGIKHNELQQGESLQHFASRLVGGYAVATDHTLREDFSVHYSYGSIAQEFSADNNSTDQSLYSY